MTETVKNKFSTAVFFREEICSLLRVATLLWWGGGGGVACLDDPKSYTGWGLDPW